MADIKKRSNAAAPASASFDTDVKGKGKEKAADEYDPLSVLDEDGEAEPLDNEEQRRVVQELMARNKRSAWWFRGAMLLMQGLLFIFYLMPLPDYAMGTHPQNHLTMHYGKGHGTLDDLVYLPAWPVYLLILFCQGSLLLLLAYETADAMDLPFAVSRRKGVAFPAQPHPFGTCPHFLVPTLSQIRWAPSGGRADQAHVPTEGPRIVASTSPRLMYLVTLLFGSLPLPLLVFGAGAFDNAGWWALTSAIIVVACVVEWSIWTSERDAKGLEGMRYNYKGA